MVPFFVADRPMSLRILKGLPLMQYPNVRIGIMSHAYTSANFQKKFREYPCENLDFCDAVGGPCKHPDNITDCPVRQHISEHTLKICDSGIFVQEGEKLDYPSLFEIYDHMGADYGIMIDVFRNPQATIESAKEALKAYRTKNYKFELVGVAQGNHRIEEYLECYSDLKKLGFHYIAIGGLLHRQDKAVRFTFVAEEEHVFSILDTIRGESKNRYDWLFALGCFNSNRLKDLAARNVWADHKGWIFHYKKRNDVLGKNLNQFASLYRGVFSNQHQSESFKKLNKTVNLYTSLLQRKKQLFKQLVNQKKTVRAYFSSIQTQVQETPNAVNQFKKIATRTILENPEVITLEKVLEYSSYSKEERTGIIQLLASNKRLNTRCRKLEARLELSSKVLAIRISKLMAEDIKLPKDAESLCAEIVELAKLSEQDYRVQQVRGDITAKILEPLSVQYKD